MSRHGLIVIIDLEHDDVAVHVKCPKVVLFVRVIGVAKVVEHRDGFDDPLNRPGDCASKAAAGRLLERRRRRLEALNRPPMTFPALLLGGSWEGPIRKVSRAAACHFVAVLVRNLPRAPRQPSGGRTTQKTTPLFGPTCLGAQT
jgi:hypothetical protein